MRSSSADRAFARGLLRFVRFRNRLFRSAERSRIEFGFLIERGWDPGAPAEAFNVLLLVLLLVVTLEPDRIRLVMRREKHSVRQLPNGNLEVERDRVVRGRERYFAGSVEPQPVVRQLK